MRTIDKKSIEWTFTHREKVETVVEKNLERRYQLDALKAICAFFVVCLHAPFPGVVGEYINVLSRMAVPIYFIITGILLL